MATRWRRNDSRCRTGLRACVEALSGDTGFLTVTVVTLIGGTLAFIGGFAHSACPSESPPVGSALPGADPLAAGIRRLVSGALAHREGHDLTVRPRAVDAGVTGVFSSEEPDEPEGDWGDWNVDRLAKPRRGTCDQLTSHVNMYEL